MNLPTAQTKGIPEEKSNIISVFLIHPSHATKRNSYLINRQSFFDRVPLATVPLWKKMEREGPRRKICGLPLNLQSREALQHIQIAYCKEHEQILIQHQGEVTMYTTVSYVQSSSVWRFMVKFVVSMLIVSLLTLAIVDFSSPPPQALSSTTTTTKANILALPSQMTALPLLRNDLFNLQVPGQLHLIATLFQYHQFDQSILSVVLQRLEYVIHMMGKDIPPCLCHHHLHQNYSIGSRYAPVCLIEMAPHRWQPLINPKPIPLEEVLQRIPISTRSAIKETSWILPNATRWRQNALGIKSIWPNYLSNDATHYWQVEHIVYDRVAHCMALALAEMETLQLI